MMWTFYCRKPVFVWIIPLMLVLDGCSKGEAPRTAVPVVTVVTPTVIRTLPHDTRAFTQGLFFVNGHLFESTGAPPGRESSLRVINPADGSVLSKRPIPGVFAEGLARRGNSAIQLTWRDGVVFVYSLPDLILQKRVSLPEEGWGLTANADSWIMSNGSDTLLFRDELFAVKRRLPVTFKGQPLVSINELEFCRGKVYANVWHSADIFEIDPGNGRVTRIIDCSGLVEQAGVTSSEDVLNGIAFNDQAGTFFVTGKNWPKIFEVKF